MDELIEQVAQKTGLSPDLARSATEAVLGFLKDKLPDALGGQIDQLLNGGDSGGLGGVVKSLGGMFGKQS